MHTAIGVVIALLALVAFFVYAQLPPHHADYRGGAFALGSVAAAAALSYWLWCANRCLRDDVSANAEAIEDARAELRTAKAEVLAKLDGMALHVSEIAQAVAENQGSTKELTAALGEVSKGLTVLTECYLQEGTIPPKDGPPETW